MHDTRATTERRSNHGLRLVFPAACEALRPFFDPAGRWQGQSHEHLAYRSLREQFPQLSAQETFVAVSTVKRLLVLGQFPPAP